MAESHVAGDLRLATLETETAVLEGGIIVPTLQIPDLGDAALESAWLKGRNMSTDVLDT